MQNDFRRLLARIITLAEAARRRRCKIPLLRAVQHQRMFPHLCAADAAKNCRAFTWGNHYRKGGHSENAAGASSCVQALRC